MFSCLLQSCHGLVIYMLRLSSDGDICAVVSHDATVAPTFLIAVGKPPSTAPLSRSLSVSLSLSLDSLVTQACRRGVSPWWNRGRQLFLQPQGHYLKSDRDSSEWTWERWGRREGEEERKRERRESENGTQERRKGGGGEAWGQGGRGGSVVQVYCPAEGEGAGRQMNPAGIWYTPEIAYRSRSQYSGRSERGLRIFWGS